MVFTKLIFMGQKIYSIISCITWTLFWIILALLFYVFLWFEFSKDFANLYLAGYILEKSLAFDNLMVFMAIFSAFGINNNYKLQHKILSWGIFGAIIFRALFVIIGTSLYKISSWVELLFAIIIIWSAIKMFYQQIKPNNKVLDFNNHWSIRFIGKFIPIYPKSYGDKFFLSHQELINNKLPLPTKISKYYITPAFLCLLIIESSDIVFAFDSVPAIIAITQQPILVYAAIIFAILGLRSLYLVLSILTKYLIYLEKTVIILLLFIGAKMLLQFFSHTIPINNSLLIIFTILGIGIAASILHKVFSRFS